MSERDALVKFILDNSHSPMAILGAAVAFVQHSATPGGPRLAQAVDEAIRREVQAIQSEAAITPGDVLKLIAPRGEQIMERDIVDLLRDYRLVTPRVAAKAADEIQKLRDFARWVGGWTSSPVGHHSMMDLNVLFAKAREKIAALDSHPLKQ